METLVETNRARFDGAADNKPLSPTLANKELLRRIDWFIRLRWWAVAGAAVVITTTVFLFRLDLPAVNLYAANLFLLLQNTIYTLYNRRLKLIEASEEWARKANRLATTQISLDLFTLTLLLHLSGGAENPFAFFFIFHMVIASILLSTRVAYLQATLAVGLFTGLLLGEYKGVLPHHHLGMLLSNPSLYVNLPYLLSASFVFIVTMFTTVYMATSIVRQLRKGEEEITAANAALEEKDRVKSEYVLRVSHDLKGSLGTIYALLTVTEDEMKDSLPPHLKNLILRARKRCGSLVDYVRDLLDLSRMRTMDLHGKAPLSLRDVLVKAVQSMKGRALEKNISIDFEMPKGTKVFASAVALEELFLNLLSNSLQYTPAGGRIGVRGENDLHAPVFRVILTDTGIGIPSGDLPHIFEDFYRAENAEAFDKDGNGLGLSIVKKIVESHGGDIQVQSQEGAGTIVIVTLPKIAGEGEIIL